MGNGKRIAVILVGIVLLCGGIFILTQTGNAGTSGSGSPLDSFTRLSSSDYERWIDEFFVREDAKELVSIIEKTHPIFLEDVPEVYYQAKERYLQEASRAMTIDSFYWLSETYLSSLNDGHTNMIRSTRGGINSTSFESKSFEYQSLENDSIALVITRRCLLGSDLDQAVAKLKEALERGVTKVIFDLRENSGGNSGVWYPFLDVMNMVPGEYGYIRRITPEVIEQVRSSLSKEAVEYLATQEITEKEPSNEAQANPDIQLIVLTSEVTYSSAAIFTTLVHDGGLGQIVGSESRQGASHYGETFYYQLNHSKVIGSVSWTKWIRPDPSLDADPMTKLLLDIPVIAPDDPLQVALDMLREK